MNCKERFWLLKYTCRESNPNLKNRNLPFYPLNYRCFVDSDGFVTDVQNHVPRNCNIKAAWRLVCVPAKLAKTK